MRYLTALGAGAALLPIIRSASQAADAPAAGQATTEPTGNANIDKNLAGFEFAPLVTTKLSDSLALLSGPGGNMAVLVGPDGALLVDTGVHPILSLMPHFGGYHSGNIPAEGWKRCLNLPRPYKPVNCG